MLGHAGKLSEGQVHVGPADRLNSIGELRQVREGYARGGFTFRDMQGAADAIIQAQAEWLNAVTRYRDLQTEIDRLTGRFDAAADKGINP